MNDIENIEIEQRSICRKWNADFLGTTNFQKIGIAKDMFSNIYPMNGLRHMPTSGTSGWYIWPGQEIGRDDDFFDPVHIDHLEDICPAVIKYLGLAPGWRFLYTEEYEDVWFDPSILVE